MQAVIVIRRRDVRRLPVTLRNRAADILGVSPASIEHTLAGKGWAWLPGTRDSVAAARLVQQLSEAGLQAGALTAADAEEVTRIAVFTRSAAGDQALKLLGDGGAELALTPKLPGGAALIGLRWDGKQVRPFAAGARKPGLLVWSPTLEFGVVWLREKPGEPGFSALELASFIEQGIARRSLVVLDDSYEPGAIPPPNARIRAQWREAGGDAADAKAALHGILVRAMQRSGVLRAQEPKPFDPAQPITTYEVVRRRWRRPRSDQLAAWGTAAAALACLTLAPHAPWTTAAGAAAGLSALLHSLRLFGEWLRLRARPQARVRSAAMGPVHLYGEIEPAMVLLSPLRGVKCVYYRTKHQQRGPKGGWRTVRDVESPYVPFYLRDETGRVLVDSLGAEWLGLEQYAYASGYNERTLEWVMATGVYANVYGCALADAEAPVVKALHDGLRSLFLANAGHFDVNHDGVLGDAEVAVATRALDAQLRADRSNVTMQGGVFVSQHRREPLVISSGRALPLGLVRGAAVLGWALAGLAFFIAVFVFPAESATVIRTLLEH
jgi:hypothetical protein